MERPVFQPVGTPVLDIDTPALVVDLVAMELNIEVMHSYFRQANAKLRPHVASHQCPQIAHSQLAAGGTVGGVSVTTVGEAEVFSESGINSILVVSQIVTGPKIRRLCEVARRSRILVAVDNSKNVDDLAQAAQAAGVTLEAMVEVESGRGTSGVAPGQAAQDLARQISKLAGLHFGGLMAIPPVPGAVPGSNGEGSEAVYPNHLVLQQEAAGSLQPVLDAKQSIESDGLGVPNVSVGGTWLYDIASEMPGITEVQAGTYPLMDYDSCQIRGEFSQAAKVLTQVISHPVEARAVVDAGHKATGPDLGIPVLEGFAGAKATRFSAEHGSLELEGEAVGQFKPGDKAWLLPYHLGLCLNQYDYIRAVRDGKLEGFWLMSGRGRFG
ncbi:MAG: hypothetical protein BZY75_03320 [SAR202 cluster bacterium Io17-Chloro-G7]|nr:MAG: hypothetical protein BZY75_03320 [SAR202 cluster bacterium Io17-Chloro-G7]